ncbi:MAG: phosphotransferase family protein [Solirubrobacteraceae bacterium]
MTEGALRELPARVRAAIRRRWGTAEVGPLQPLPGGISSLTFAATVSGAGDAVRRVVVKVAPPGLAPVRNRDVLRQARVLAAIHGAPGVLVPEVLVSDDGSPPFFVMEFVSGQAYEPKWDLSEAPPAPAVVDARARAAARMLARLHAIDPAAAGIDEPALTLAEEVQRWASLFATAGEGLRGRESELRDALAARPPAGIAPRILHGDYRLGNIQFEADKPAALIDWEIWSVGDPRTDLAWLMMFADPVAQRVAERDSANQAAAEAMPSGRTLLAQYTEEAGLSQPPADLDWFLAFCCYKLGAAMSALIKRNRRRTDPDAGLELVAITTPPMLASGLRLLGHR